MQPSDPRLPVIGDLLEGGVRLDIQCCRHGCFRRTLWSAEEAVARLGRWCTFVEAPGRLVCGGCGARGALRQVQARPCGEDQADLRQREREAREG
jgi:hypothetical protein